MDLKRIWRARMSIAHLILSLALSLGSLFILGILAVMAHEKVFYRQRFSSAFAVMEFILVFGIVAVFLVHAIRRDAQKNPGAAKPNLIALGVIAVPFLLVLSFLVIITIRNMIAPPPPSQTERINAQLQYLVEHQGDLKDSAALAQAVVKVLGADTLWKPFGQNDWNFNIDLPDFDPKESVNEVTVGSHRLAAHNVSVNTSNSLNPNLAYSVAFWRSEWINTTGQVDSLFNAQRSYLLEATHAELVNYRTLDPSAVPGREMTMRVIGSDPEVIVRCRMFFHAGVFYKLNVIATKDHVPNKAMEHFFASFHITK